MLRQILSGREKQSIGLMIVSMLSLGLMSNKRGMIGNLIGGFVAVLVGVSLMGPIAQEISNAADCMDSNLSIATSAPEGSTDSFGGAGSNHFGGYDNTVKHNGFVDAIASTSLVKSNKSLLNPDCTPMAEGSWGRTVLQIVPGFFALAVLVMGIAVAYSGLRNTRMI